MASRHNETWTQSGICSCCIIIFFDYYRYRCVILLSCYCATASHPHESPVSVSVSQMISSVFLDLCLQNFFLLLLLNFSGLVAHSDLDERAIEALKEFNEDGALQVLVQFKESDLSHVQVSSSCGKPSVIVQ